MAIITAGYDGTVDETQFAEILHRYSVLGPDDFKATTQAGDRIVAISDGVALGPGTRDVATGVPSIQFAAASGTRWDLVVLRRDWQPPGGASSVVIVQGGSSKGYPAVGTAGTNWNRRPGIIDDQPLYLQEVNGTLLGQRVDLRCWAAHGGLFAKDDLVRTYLDRVGTHVNVAGRLWAYGLGANDIAGWVDLLAPQYAEFTGPIVSTNGGFGTSWGTFTLDVGDSVNNTFAQAGSSGTVQISVTGTYDIHGIVLPAASPQPPPGKTNLTIDAGGRRIASSTGGDFNARETSVTASGIYLTAGSVISFNLATTNSVTLGSRVTVTKTR